MTETQPVDGATDERPVDPPEHLHLGCGEDYRDSWHNVDISAAVGPDQQFDIGEVPWPLPSDHFTIIRAEHVIEHVANPVPVMREATRVAAPGGYIEIVVPVGVNADTDPTHQDRWTWETPTYFTRDGPYSWEAGCELALRNRRLDLCPHRPMFHITPLLDRLANRYPLCIPELPGVSGELTVVFEVLQ